MSPPLTGLRVLLSIAIRIPARSWVLRSKAEGPRSGSSRQLRMRRRCSKSGGPTCWSATVRSPIATPTRSSRRSPPLKRIAAGRIPALALTTAGGVDERMRQMLSEVQRSLPKPVEPSILTAEIARLTGRERRRAHR